MIKDLFIGERILINKENEKILAFRVTKSGPRLIDSEEIEFIKDKASIMEKLNSGSIVDISTDGTTVTSKIIGATGIGENIQTAVEDLDNKISMGRQ